jgi:hypothetical protein
MKSESLFHGIAYFSREKERPTEAPFLSWKKAIPEKSLKRSAGNSSKKKCSAISCSF